MKKLVQFVKECAAEMKKVVWPTKADVASSIKVVLLSTFVIAGLLGLLDFLFVTGIRKIF